MILYLVLKELLDLPILYLSGYITKHKSDYYRLLNEVRTKNAREEYVLYMLRGIEQQAEHTTQQLIDIDALIKDTKEKVKSVEGIRYSEEFVMSLFHSHSFSIT